MRQAISLFLLVLVSSSWAVQISETIPSMAASTLPRNILSEIAARIASEGPLDDIFTLFDDLVSQIRKEQVEHDQLYEKQSQECKVEIAFRQKEVSDAESALGAATQEKNACSTSRSQNKAELETNLKTQQDLESNIQILDQQRASEKARFDALSSQYQNSLNALDEGHKILQELYTGSATLIDLSRVTVQLFKNSLAISASHHYAPVLGALAQIAQKADLLIDPSVLQRIEALFKQLHDKIAGDLKTAEESEAKAVEDFQQNRERLVQQVEALKKAEKTLRNNIANYDQCIVKASNIIAQATAKKERNANLLAEAEKMCKTFEDEYKIANQQRKEELDLIAKLKKIVADKLKFTSGVTERGTQTEEQWSKYENKAKISEGPFVKKESTYSEGGAKLSGFKRDLAGEAFVEAQ